MAEITQQQFNEMLSAAVAQGLPGGTYTSRYSGEEIDKMLAAADRTLGAVTAPIEYVTVEGKDLKAYLKALPRLVDRVLSISVTGEASGTIDIVYFYGPGRISINGGGNAAITGRLDIQHNKVPVWLTDVSVVNNIENTYAVNSVLSDVYLMNCTFDSGGKGSGIHSSRGTISSNNIGVKNCKTAVRASYGGILSCNGSAANFSGSTVGAEAYRGGIVVLSGTVPATAGGATNALSGGLIVTGRGTIL